MLFRSREAKARDAFDAARDALIEGLGEVLAYFDAHVPAPGTDGERRTQVLTIKERLSAVHERLGELYFRGDGRADGCIRAAQEQLEIIRRWYRDQSGLVNVGSASEKLSETVARWSAL